MKDISICNWQILAVYTGIAAIAAFALNQHPKTQKGYELYIKLKGLKKYIKDFSNITEKRFRTYKIMGWLYNIRYYV